MNYLIVGASSGIGKKLAESLVAEGHTVYATYFRNKVQSDIAELQYHYLDVTEENLMLDFLPERINGLVYCPGSINLKPFARIQPNEFVSDFNLQVVGAIKVLQAVLPKLKIAEEASVVLFSTVAVQTGLSFHAQVASSKGAIEGLIRALAAELAPKIRVNGIAPSLTDTPLASSLLNTEQKVEANAQRHPLKRIGTTSDIADMASFLLSAKAGWVTGQIFHVDGGISSIK